MNNYCNRKNKNYYNINYNNFYPLNNNCNLYCCDKKNKIKNNSCMDSLYEVENFLCNINQLSKYLKIIKYLK